MSNGYNFTERVRKVLAMSREEASRLHHEYVGTEHLLLGLLREGQGVAAGVLQTLGVDLTEMTVEVDRSIRLGDAAQPTGPDLPYTSRAKKVLELSMTEARDLHHSYVGTEHLLLGLLREEKGIAAQILNKSGISIEKARVEVRRFVDTEAPTSSEASVGQVVMPRHESSRRSVSSFTVLVHYTDGTSTEKHCDGKADAMMFLARQ